MGEMDGSNGAADGGNWGDCGPGGCPMMVAPTAPSSPDLEPTTMPTKNASSVMQTTKGSNLQDPAVEDCSRKATLTLAWRVLSSLVAAGRASICTCGDNASNCTCPEPSSSSSCENLRFGLATLVLAREKASKASSAMCVVCLQHLGGRRARARA